MKSSAEIMHCPRHLNARLEGARAYMLMTLQMAEFFQHRNATRSDLPALTVLMDLAISELQRPFLRADQIESSRNIMGLDTQLIDDGTYFVIETAGSEARQIAGCGGWSRRSTLYGGDHSPGRDAVKLDPSVDAARVRAMYTAPGFVRRGVGRLILTLCESAAAAEGFNRLELVGTLSGEPLYRTAGYKVIERFEDARGGAPVPLARMGKTLLRDRGDLLTRG